MKRVGLFMDRGKSCVRDVLDGVAMFLDQLPPSERWECWYEIDLEINELRPIELDGALAMVHHQEAADRVTAIAPKIVGVLGRPSMELPFPVVTCDDEEVGRIAARELIRRGHRELVFVSAPEAEPFDHVRARLQGFTAEAQDAGAKVHVGPAPMTLRAFLQMLPRPCGVLAMTDETGKFVLDVCRAEKIRVPRDVAVIGVDNDVQTCELSWPPLATVSAGHFEVGYHAARRLHRILAGDQVAARVEVELVGKPEVVVRTSVDTLAVDDDLVSKALQYIAMHAHEPMSVPELCEAIGAGRRSLEQRFKKATGKSILEELHWARVQIAKRLLKNRRLSIEQVARLAGFGTQTYMGVVFRRLVGMTPSQHRQQRPKRPKTTGPA